MNTTIKSKKKKIMPKTQEARSLEVEKIMSQFMELGLPLDMEGVQKFIKITKEYEKDGIGSSGFIKLVGLGRILEYKYSTRPYVTSEIVLRNAPHI
jgi:hypothetical protein